MRTFCLAIVALLFTAVAHGQTEPPALPVVQDDPAFAAKVDLTPLRAMAVQHLQTVKTFDSYARQTLSAICGHGTYDGQDPVFTVLDIAYRPSAWTGVNIIKIKNAPLRTDFLRLAFLSKDEQDRILNTGLVSLDLIGRPEVQSMLKNAQSSDARKATAVQQLAVAIQTMGQLVDSFGGHDLFLPAAIVPPVAAGDTAWHHVIDLAGADPDCLAIVKKIGLQAPPAPAGYTAAAVQPVVRAAIALYTGWQQQDPRMASVAAAKLAESVAVINPAVYPSAAQRTVEVWYNKLAKMTLPGAACYFFAFVCFLAGSRSGLPSLRLWGLRLLALGLLVHTTGIAIRWWLVGGIPIKNEFESVMFSAWFGVVVGTALELGLLQAAVRGVARLGGVTMTGGAPIRGVFGTAASFVGWLSLIAIFAAPYVFDANIGQEVGMANGVLYSYWLYIHVTMVTASYALIGMGFLLSVWWLVKYYANRADLVGVSPRQMEGEARGFDVVYPGGAAVSGGAVSLPTTLAQMVFFPVARADPRPLARPATVGATNPTVNFLAALDACNLVVLQLAFWVLGAGIVFGAIWADMSWGRPWAWDPKETFALVTWIVYLIVVHVRVTTEAKAWWTATLSTVGFFVMLFNWVGVNYYLHGLHSYA